MDLILIKALIYRRNMYSFVLVNLVCFKNSVVCRKCRVL